MFGFITKILGVLVTLLVIIVFANLAINNQEVLAVRFWPFVTEFVQLPFYAWLFIALFTGIVFTYLFTRVQTLKLIFSNRTLEKKVESLEKRLLELADDPKPTSLTSIEKHS